MELNRGNVGRYYTNYSKGEYRTSNIERKFYVRNKPWFSLHKQHERSVQFTVHLLLYFITLEEKYIDTYEILIHS